jgi:hypothetical protein
LRLCFANAGEERPLRRILSWEGACLGDVDAKLDRML